MVADGCEPPCGWWGLNSGPLAEQSGVLIRQLRQISTRALAAGAWLKENGTRRFVYPNAWSPVGRTAGRMRTCGLLRASVSQRGSDFEVSKDHTTAN